MKIGLLPLYLKLYDEVCPDVNDAMEDFVKTISSEYQKQKIEVITAKICKEKEEFQNAINQFENNDVDAIVTLHLAYSPSLESSDILAETDLPIVILDTTQDAEFGFDQTKDAIMFNHGIHGVQDMCNLLIRNNKSFMLEAGHWKESDVIKRTISHIKGCHAAKAFRKSRVGIIGQPFAGMGDFTIPFDILKREIGIEVISSNSNEIARLMPATDSEEVKKEIEEDVRTFSKGAYSDESLADSETAVLGVRRWIEQEELSAFTMNFGNITGAPGLPVVPFLEASKAMARGIGYAGEGDVLTAAFCGAVATVVPETTFTEMFCPDWKGNKIFMSHMGEINIDLTAQTPVLEQRPYPFSAAGEPVIAAGCLKPGAAWLLNVAPGKENSFTLVAAPVKVCDTEGNEKIDSGIRGWIKPEMPIVDFLKQYSLNGGTHHCILCYEIDERFVEAFTKTMNWKYALIK